MLANRFTNVRPALWMIHAAGGAALAALAAACYFGLIAPAAAAVETRTARMEQLRLLVASSEKVGADHRALARRLDELRQSAAAARQRMPGRTSTEEFIDRITQLAAVTGVEIELCSAAAPEILKTHTRVEVTCNFSGPYASICQFLAAIDQLSQVSTISSFTVDAATNSRSYPVHLTFQLYYRGELHDTELKQRVP